MNQRSEVKSTLVYGKEIVNLEAFRHFCEHLKGILDAEQQKGNAVICEVWSFPQGRPLEATAKPRLEQN